MIYDKFLPGHELRQNGISIECELWKIVIEMKPWVYSIILNCTLYSISNYIATGC